MKGHAEIAGGGISGLACAMMLARQGWTVRVHERGQEIRDGGTGLYIKNNAAEVLEEYGIFDRLLPHGSRLERAQRVDAAGHIMQERSLAGQARVHVFVRQMLIEVLRDAAQKEGAEVVTGSVAVAADPAGELHLGDGSRLRADLVIVADGARSMVRDTLDIGASYEALPTLVNRYLVPSGELPLEPIMKEHWSGRYRIGTAPCGDRLSFVYQVYPELDKAASALPSNVAVWSKAFPCLRTEIELFSRASAIQHRYSVVRCARWSTGRVAITGDAAHGLPPALGQGVGLVLMNARALAMALEGDRPVEDALPAWEAAVRFIADNAQRWALRYDFLTRRWPSALWFMRPAIIWAFRSIPALGRRMRIADQGLKLIPRELFTGSAHNELHVRSGDLSGGDISTGA
jgi:2-polyprenyl-6-methoxyphenol hydroxylase-like FAD-dependent oxidoreductase